MCFLTFFSTDSDETFTDVRGETWSMESPTQEDRARLEGVLKFKNVRFLSTYGGCSCHFRNLLPGNELEFWEPKDWHPEDAEDIQATAEVYELFRRLVEEGHRVDSATTWNDDFSDLPTVEVSLAKVSQSEFQFFGDHLFDFVK